jgi:peptidoglycan/xylan/chitin deacetylase (PgdA/CDA1 family)
VPVTVSACAVALELNPEVAAWMRERGHDLLGHGWRWTEPWTQSRDEEREHLHRAIETFERVLGERPLGWNSRSFPSESTRELLVEEGGFLYDSDPSNDDLPYYARSGGRPVLIVPYTKTYQDARYLVSPGFASPRDYLETLTMGLDELLADDRPAMMTVVAHARWSGQAARAAAIRAFLADAVSRPGVRFMRRLDIARWWLEQLPPGA